MGRSSTFTAEIAAQICERLSQGEPLRVICRDEGMPHFTTVYAWRETHPDFALRFARAREIGFDAIAEEALEIADTPVEGVRQEQSADGFKVVREDMLGHRKLQVETRLKLLAKWSPKRYGDRLDIGNADDKPFKVDDTATANRMAELLELARQRRDGTDLV